MTAMTSPLLQEQIATGQKRDVGWLGWSGMLDAWSDSSSCSIFVPKLVGWSGVLSLWFLMSFLLARVLLQILYFRYIV